MLNYRRVTSMKITEKMCVESLYFYNMYIHNNYIMVTLEEKSLPSFRFYWYLQWHFGRDFWGNKFWRLYMVLEPVFQIDLGCGGATYNVDI